MMTRFKRTVIAAATLMMGFGTALSATAAGATPGNWSGNGSLTGHSMCSGGFTMSFTVSEAGLVSGKLITAEGAQGFRNTYTLQGRVDPVDGHSFKGEASSVYVLKLRGLIDDAKGEGTISFDGKQTCFGQWSAQREAE